MTKTTINKAAKTAGIDISLIKVSRNYDGVYRIQDADLPIDLVRRNIEYAACNGFQLPEVEKRIRVYNREVKKLLKALGVKNWGFLTGYGAWHYELSSMSESTKLAFANID